MAVFAGFVFRVIQVCVFLVVIIGHDILRLSRDHVAVHGLLNGVVTSYRSQMLLIDGLAGLFLLDHAEDTIVQMLVEVLRVLKGC